MNPCVCGGVNQTNETQVLRLVQTLANEWARGLLAALSLPGAGGGGGQPPLPSVVPAAAAEAEAGGTTATAADSDEETDGLAAACWGAGDGPTRLLPFGSYRLDVHDPTSDLDLLLVSSEKQQVCGAHSLRPSSLLLFLFGDNARSEHVPRLSGLLSTHTYSHTHTRSLSLSSTHTYTHISRATHMTHTKRWPPAVSNALPSSAPLWKSTCGGTRRCVFHV